MRVRQTTRRYSCPRGGNPLLMPHGALHAPPDPDQIAWMVRRGYAKQAAIMQASGATRQDFARAISALQRREYSLSQGPNDKEVCE